MLEGISTESSIAHFSTSVTIFFVILLYAKNFSAISFRQLTKRLPFRNKVHTSLNLRKLQGETGDATLEVITTTLNGQNPHLPRIVWNVLVIRPAKLTTLKDSTHFDQGAPGEGSILNVKFENVSSTVSRLAEKVIGTAPDEGDILRTHRRPSLWFNHKLWDDRF